MSVDLIYACFNGEHRSKSASKQIPNSTFLEGGLDKLYKRIMVLPRDQQLDLVRQLFGKMQVNIILDPYEEFELERKFVIDYLEELLNEAGINHGLVNTSRLSQYILEQQIRRRQAGGK